MKNAKKLQINQLEEKLMGLTSIPDPPTKGWIHAIRTTLGISFRQLGERLSITAQSVQEMEGREANGTITLKTLREVAQALDMKLVYGFVPKGNSLESLLEQQALAVARKIVLRTDNTMKLEDQRVSKERIEKAVRELADELKSEMPRYLWD